MRVAARRNASSQKELKMRNAFSYLSFLGILLWFWSCKQETQITDDISNLIHNSSFETNGQPTFQTWIADTTLARLVQDVPNGGGSWSLRLEPGWIPQEGFARTYITGESGTGGYYLRVWTKSINRWRGSVTIGKWSGNTLTQTKSAYSDSSGWNYIALVDSLSLESGDSIGVHLSAGSTELSNGAVLFDLITLQRIR